MKKQFSYNLELKYLDSVDQDQTVQNVQSDLDLHCPHKLLVSSSSVRKELIVYTNMGLINPFPNNKY